MLRLALLLLASAASGMSPLPAPQETAYDSPNRQFRVVVTPSAVNAPKKPGDAPGGEAGGLTVPGDKPGTKISVQPPAAPDGGKTRPAVAKFYKKKPVGDAWELVKQFDLVNPVAPLRVLVMDDGRSFVTVDEYPPAFMFSFNRPKKYAAVVVYALPDGKVKAFYDKPDIFSVDVVEIWLKPAGHWWTEGATFKSEWQDGKVERVVADLFWGQRVTMRLHNGFVDAAWVQPELRPDSLTEGKALKMLSEDRDHKVKRGLLEWLGKHGTRASLPQIQKLIEAPVAPPARPFQPSPGHRVRSAAFMAYGALADRRDVPYLLKKAKQGGEWRTAHMAIANVFQRERNSGKAAPVPADVAEYFLGRLSSKEAGDRSEAAHYAFAIQLPRGKQAIHDALKRETDEDTRRTLEHIVSMYEMSEQAPPPGGPRPRR